MDSEAIAVLYGVGTTYEVLQEDADAGAPFEGPFYVQVSSGPVTRTMGAWPTFKEAVLVAVEAIEAEVQREVSA